MVRYGNVAATFGSHGTRSGVLTGWLHPQFRLRHAVLSSGNYVQLVDQSQNTTSGVPEALYVNSLVVPAGATLDLYGYHLYARTAQIDGTILNGVVQQVPDSGPLALNTPTPGDYQHRRRT